MSATIFKHEFIGRLKSVLIWSGSMVLLLLIFFSIFPSFSSQAALLNEMLAKFPPQLLEAFGMTHINLSSVLGFFAFLFTFVQLCLAIQAGNYGVGLVSVEETDLTADFLMTKPVSRWQVMNSKLLAATCSLLLTDIIVWVATFVCIALFRGTHPVDTTRLILILVSLLLFQFFFFSVGLLISLLVKRVRSVTPYGLGLAFAAYIINGFSGIFGDVKLEYITPFKHFDPSYMAQNGALNTPLVLLSVSISVIALVASYWLYLHRDIPAVS
jgi:ABC-2 type transport system permease protein